MVARISTDGEFKKVKFEHCFFCLASYFLPAKAMQNNFREFEELVFFDLWIPVSGFRILVSDSGFRFPILDSSFWVLGLP